MNSLCCTTPRPPLPCVHVHPAHPYPQHRRAVLHLPPRALRAHRLDGATTHPAQPGRHFDVAQSDWPVLCRRIDELLAGQWPLPPDGPPALESHAQRITALLLAGERIGAASSPASQRHDFQHVDVDSLELIRPPLGRRGARRPVGDGPARPAHAARSTGHRGVGTHRRHRALHHRAHGPARLRARHPALAGRTQRPGRTPGRGLRDDGGRCGCTAPPMR